MSRKIRLIWDFKGEDSRRTAEHHCIHLKEFDSKENLNSLDFQVEKLNDMYYIAYMTVLEENVFKIRDALLPHRAEIEE
jgi:hypothetical protein